jgi:hypothetical protein
MDILNLSDGFISVLKDHLKSMDNGINKAEKDNVTVDPHTFSKMSFITTELLDLTTDNKVIYNKVLLLAQKLKECSSESFIPGIKSIMGEKDTLVITRLINNAKALRDYIYEIIQEIGLDARLNNV